MSGLFGDDDTPSAPAPDRSRLPAASGHGGARPGAGRPANSLTGLNRELREYLVKLTGKEAIVDLYRLAATPFMTDRTVLLKLAKYFDCSPKEAVELILKSAALVFPKVYPSLGSLELKAPGAPDAAGLLPDYVDPEGGGVVIGDAAYTIIDEPAEALDRAAIEQAIAEEEEPGKPEGGAGVAV